GPRPANRYVSTINSGRVSEIQSALIKLRLMEGPPNGVYDQATFSAMQSFQARQGFETTGMPTARALKALGVRKSSGVGTTTPAQVLQSTAPARPAPQAPQPTPV